MSRNVSEAAAGSSEITSNIAGVAEVAEKTSRDAAGTQEAMQQLVQMATKLRQLVERFKTDKDESQNTQAMAAGR
jgi:methyl-accepting chemotaxis protein